MGASSAQFVTGPQGSRRDLPSENTVDIGDVLLMQVGEVPCCVAVAQITELIRVPALARVPLAPPAVLGLFNHRSKVATAFSLRWYLGLEDGVPGEGFLVMSRMDNDLVGYQVDEISDILHPSADDWREVPPHLSLDFCDRILVQPGHLFALMDFACLRAAGLSREGSPGEQESQTLAHVLQAVRTGSLADLEVSPRRAAHDSTVSAVSLPPTPGPEMEQEVEPVEEPPQESGMDAPAEQSSPALPVSPVEAAEAVSEKHESVSQSLEQMADGFAPALAKDEAEATADAAAKTESEVSMERETEEEIQAIEENEVNEVNEANEANEAKEQVQGSPSADGALSQPVLPAMHNLADWEVALLEPAASSGTATEESAETLREDKPQPRNFSSSPPLEQEENRAEIPAKTEAVEAASLVAVEKTSRPPSGDSGEADRGEAAQGDQDAGSSFELAEVAETIADKAPAGEPSSRGRHRISGRHVAAAALLLFLGGMALRFASGWGQPEKPPAAEQVSPPAIIDQVEEIEPPSPAPALEGPPPAPPVPTEEVSSGAVVITPDLSDNFIHTVVAGDSLSKLAARYLGDWRRYPELVDENDVENPDLILVDEKLLIPPAGE